MGIVERRNLSLCLLEKACRRAIVERGFYEGSSLRQGPCFCTPRLSDPFPLYNSNMRCKFTCAAEAVFARPIRMGAL